MHTTHPVLMFMQTCVIPGKAFMFIEQKDKTPIKLKWPWQKSVKDSEKDTRM